MVKRTRDSLCAAKREDGASYFRPLMKNVTGSPLDWPQSTSWANWPMACCLKATSALFIFYCSFACQSYLPAGTYYDRLLSDGRSTNDFVHIESPWVRSRRRGNNPAPHRMPLNQRYLFLASTAIEPALFLG